ncbi:MAG: VapE domain-containing protein [Prevotella sp.]
MNEVNYFSSLRDKEPKLVAWETVATEIRSDRLAEVCRQYRALLPHYDKAVEEGDNDKAAAFKSKLTALKTQLPAIMPQVRLSGGRTADCITGYERYMIVDIDHIPADVFDMTVKMVRDDLHSRLTYITISGRGLRVIAEVEGEVTNENFRDAWLSVNDYYKKLTSLDYDTQCGNNTRVCGLAHDPKAVFRPCPKRIKIVRHETKAKTKKRVGRPPKVERIEDRVMEMVEADGAEYIDGRHNDYITRCLHLMNRYGVPKKKCLEWAVEQFDDYNATHRGSLQNMVKSIYTKYSDDHATLSSGTGKASVKQVEKYVANHYDLRRNLLSYQLEYRKLKVEEGRLKVEDAHAQQFNIQYSIFKAIDDHFVNSLWRQMQNDGVMTDLQTINTILGSNFVTDYHPFRSWLDGLKPWDGSTDYIRQFFSMVHCKDTSEEEFHFYTRCWFLAMVASVLDDKVVNHQILTFIGEQGTYKSSFMLNILPPHLRNYFATKNNSYQLDKDDYLMLAENIIISLEEIDSMTMKEINQLKAFTTMPQVKERPPYGRHKVLMPRVASLCATGNNLTFLTDQTGNRRWLPFHVESIDNPWTTDIPYEGMYAQAYALIEAGEQYWLNDKQIKELNERNKQFLTPDPATEMIVTYFTIPRTESETKYMTASKIAAKFAPRLTISATKIGIALANLGYEQMRNKNGRFWKVADRPEKEIDSRMPGEEPEPLPF